MNIPDCPLHEITDEDYEKGEGQCVNCGYLVICHDGDRE